VDQIAGGRGTLVIMAWSSASRTTSVARDEETPADDAPGKDIDDERDVAT
jgi:hypothetical protein